MTMGMGGYTQQQPVGLGRAALLQQQQRPAPPAPPPGTMASRPAPPPAPGTAGGTIVNPQDPSQRIQLGANGLPVSQAAPPPTQAPQGVFAPQLQAPTVQAPPAGSTLVTPTDGTAPYFKEPGGAEVDLANLSQNVGAFGNIGSTSVQGSTASGYTHSYENDPNYQNYAQFSTAAQQLGAQAGQGLSDPRVQAAIAQQTQLAGGASGYQQQGLGAAAQVAQGGGFGGANTQNSLGLLANAAAGNGPTAADIQQQQGISQAMRAQLTAAASARGGAYAQSAAQQQAAGQASQIQLQGVGQAAQLRAQEQQAAQSAYAGAAGQAYSTQAGAAGQLASAANQQYAGQVQAAQAAAQSATGQQTNLEQYYEGQQQAYQAQAAQAANLTENQVANAYGLTGTQLQTQTQQNIANQQATQQEVSAGIGLGAAALMALA